MAAPSSTPCRAAAVSAEGPSHSWVADDAALAQAVARCGPLVGLDTEFQRVNTFFPIAGLYQLASPAGLWLIDPLAIDDWTPLRRLLEDPACVKVMHSCSEDLELIHHHLGVRLRNLFDTQLAYAFLSEHYSFSYGALTEAVLGIELPKQETRSDWLRRPLSAAQRHYACADVAHLPDLHGRLRTQLEARQRLPWFQEETRRREAQWRSSLCADPAEYYMEVRGAWRLHPEQLGALRSLCAWREGRARQEDRPRQWVVGDAQLLEFARQPTLSQPLIDARLPRRSARRYGEALQRAHGEGRRAPVVETPPRPLSRRQAEALKEMRDLGRSHAQALGLAAQLLSRKRDLELCLRHHAAYGELPDFWQGWRRNLVGAAFADLLERGPPSK